MSHPRSSWSAAREPTLGQIPESLSLWTRWPTIAAVRDGNLYVVDADLIARSSTRVLRGVRQICAHLDTARGKGAEARL